LTIQKLFVFMLKLQKLQFWEFSDKKVNEKNNLFDIMKRSIVYKDVKLIYLMIFKYTKFIRFDDYYNNQYNIRDIAQWGNNFFDMTYIYLNWYNPTIFIDPFLIITSKSETNRLICRNLLQVIFFVVIYEFLVNLPAI
jgi:hypothetical protein